jgi:EAL domain-containing protein (putative c-di-GMP-specific phosphodiesterase class I)
MSDRSELLDLLHKAVEDGDFEVYFQPEFYAVEGNPASIEALLRWRHPQRGLVAPAVFLALCEDSGLILPLGRWVLGEACQSHKRLVEAGWPGVSISVNVSASQFRDPQLVDSVREQMTAHSTPAGALELELPEAIIARDPDFAVDVMTRLAALGVVLTIGDFGTGYSSMSTLYRVPADRIKIDRSVVRGVPDDANNAALCRSIISLGHGKNLKVVAEGVETSEELAWLRANGCDGVQGYLFARPAPFTEMLRALGRLPA